MQMNMKIMKIKYARMLVCMFVEDYFESLEKLFSAISELEIERELFPIGRRS